MPDTPAPLYQRILVATGGAAHSEKAVQRAISLAQYFQAVLDLVSVVPLVPNALVNMAAGLPGSEAFEGQVIQNTRTMREQHLTVTAAEARRQGLIVYEHLIQAAKPAEAILSVAQMTGAELIVLGRRHTNAFSAAFAGSTGDAVSHAASVDVLIAR